MLASFFEVDVCSLARKGEQTQPGGKKEDGAGGRWACRRDRLHRFIRDSFAGAACAGPEGQNTPADHARENLRSTTIQRARDKDDGHRRCEERRTAAPERRQTLAS